MKRWNRVVVMMQAVVGFAMCGIGSGYAQDSLSFWDDRASIGGELRGRGEFFDNFYTSKPSLSDGSSNSEDDRFLLRTRLHLDFHPDDSFRIFIEGQDSRAWESDLIRRTDGIPNGFDDDFDLFQAYMDLSHIADSPVSLRVGRQVLSYGKQRLIGGFNWSNVARAFDAVKLNLDLEDMGGSIDMFVGEAVTNEWDSFNEFADNDSTFYGIYSTWKQVPYVDFLEGYYLVDDNDNAKNQIHTLGVRAGRKYDSNWDWEIELAGQFGEFLDQDHSAFASHIETGYTFDHEFAPRVAVGYSYATGDDDPDENHTFVNLYPTNHMHYGQMDLFSWRNMHDVEIDFSVKPLEQVAAFVELHNFILDEEDNDAWYNAGGVPLRRTAAGMNSGAYVGSELDFRVQYKAAKWLNLEGGYSHFFAGEYIDDTGDDDDADWGYIQASVPF